MIISECVEAMDNTIGLLALHSVTDSAIITYDIESGHGTGP